MREGETPSAHLSVERMAAYLDQRLSPADRADAVSHLADCAECRRELREAREVIVRAPATRRRALLPVAIALAAALAFIVVLRVPRLNDDGSGAQRGALRAVDPAAVPGIAVVGPTAGDSVAAAGLRFVWHPEAGEPEYHLTLQDASGAVVWRLPTADTLAVLPASVALVSGAEYFWTVDALRSDGGSATTRSQRFFVR